MLTAFVDGLMPGIRSLRPPVFAGILWALVVWLVIADELPPPKDATGWIAQVYAVMGWIGTAGLAVVVGVAVFLIGVAALALTDPLATLVGRLGREFTAVVQWQRYARARRRDFGRVRAEALGTIESLKDQNTAAAERRRASAQAEISQVEEGERYFGRRANPRRLYTPRTKKARHALGEPPLVPFESESSVITELITDALFDAMHADGKSPDDFSYIDESGDTSIAERLNKELGSDPLEVVRGLDEGLYSDLDRERGERLVRLAVSFPLIALGLYVAITITPWLGIVVAAAGVVLLVRYSTVQSGERDRILNLLVLNSKFTAAMKAASREGQLRYFSARREYDRREKRRAKEEEEQRAEAAAKRARQAMEAS
ncbi:hypothetical protein SAMN04487846_2274 [Microbacterium sp. cf046]|uniref:hypothetical protein n=1 Tax=Microbacterium sp. cf046 TaxID=1761803 RepID=UPI0008E7D263|nr:hypothetical protein [Microbacterium sp. cf046]SFS07710.1 hypothetical protein SAMN04487846_2274 [Microbacterium sp. cf046]